MRRHEALEILRQHEAEIRRFGVRVLLLFGSVARDEAKPGSDVDLLVEFDRPTGIFGFLRLKRFLELILQQRVDLGTTDALQPDLRERVAGEAVRAA